jgi:hypothetical protein
MHLEAIHGEEATKDAFLEPRPQHDHIVLLIHLSQASSSADGSSSRSANLPLSLALLRSISSWLTVYRGKRRRRTCAKTLFAVARGTPLRAARSTSLSRAGPAVSVSSWSHACLPSAHNLLWTKSKRLISNCELCACLYGTISYHQYIYIYIYNCRLYMHVYPVIYHSLN